MISATVWSEAWEGHPHLRDVLLECKETWSFQKLREQSDLHQKLTHAPTTTQPRVPIRQDEAEATLKSWDEKFRGNCVQAFLKYIDMKRKGKQRPVYAHYCAIVQSSGMGKSRLMYEVGHERIVIPICLREIESTGFPPRDASVCKFFEDAQQRGRRGVLMASYAFLSSLFESVGALFFGADSNVEEWTQHENFRGCELYKDIATRFLHFMSDGQRMDKPGQNHEMFYKKVIEKGAVDLVSPEPASCQSLDDGSADLANTDIGRRTPTKDLPEEITSRIRTEFDALLAKIDRLVDVPANNVIIIAFDEAHTLATINSNRETGETWSTFGELRRTLRELTQKYRLYSVFLSTTGSADQLAPLPHDDPSRRISSGEEVVNDAFVDLGFDHLAIRYKEHTHPEISDVVRLNRLVLIGRPLFATRYKLGSTTVKSSIIYFAAEKLLNESWPIKNLSLSQKLACLSVRLALKYEPNTLALKEQRNQVAKHMRVALCPAGERHDMVTLSASEPVLAEAARMAFNEFDVPRALLEMVKDSFVSVGERGEVIARLLLLLACDAGARPGLESYTALENVPYVMVPEFLEQLWPGCNTSQTMPTFVDGAEEELAWPHRREEPTLTLGEAFKDAKIFFNHFLQFREERVVNCQYLRTLMLRGAAAICCSHQTAIDIIIPVLFEGEELKPDKITAIVVQVKMDRRYGKQATARLIEEIDPVSLNIFDSMCYKPPIIRVVLALAAPGASLSSGPHSANKTRGTPRTSSLSGGTQTPGETSRRTRKQSSGEAFTAYDLWSAGITKFGPVAKGEQSVWEHLLDIVPRPDAMFEAKQCFSGEHLGRTMDACSLFDSAHWDMDEGSVNRSRCRDT
ncbi:hypothetical protein WOLCODRAFT_28048 [Wolfiporia cocos MD-104 SS10]|uniref:Uncharacterized protein n=1 Tax=Wolfiporia cocos (strain MD-104) TaxID=742152 RepID=A0A2H3JA82_WOLCO|nr:hypothetical protein WOLCODRAFT_28048 [Wolfiporia cocos MD-104 SS10]